MDSPTISILALGPFMIMAVCLAALLWFLMLGGSLKLSLGLFMREEPGFLKCFLLAAAIVVLNIAVVIAIVLAFGPQPWYILWAYQAAMQVFLIALLVRCNPFSALLASISHSLFGSLGTVAVAIVFVLFCGSALMGLKDRIDTWSAQNGTVAESTGSFEDSPTRFFGGKATMTSGGAATNPFVD